MSSFLVYEQYRSASRLFVNRATLTFLIVNLGGRNGAESEGHKATPRWPDFILLWPRNPSAWSYSWRCYGPTCCPGYQALLLLALFEARGQKRRDRKIW